MVEINDNVFIRGVEGVLKGVGDICYINGEVISGCNGNGKAESRYINNWGVVLVKIDTFDLWYPIGIM